MGLRQGVVEHRPGHQLAVVAIDCALPKGLPRALYDAAMHLSFHNDRVDLRSAVVGGHVPFQNDMAVVGVDLHNCYVGAEWEAEVRRVVEGGGFQARLHALGHVPSHVGHQGYVLDGLVLVGRPADEEAAVVVLNVLFGCLQQMCGQGPALVLDLARTQGDGRAAENGGAAAVSAPTHGGIVGVSVDDFYVIHRDPQFVRQDLGEGGLFTLSVRRSSYEDVDFAGGIEAHDGAFPKTAAEPYGSGDLRGADAADFTIAGYADAHIFVVASEVCLLFPQTLVVDVFQRHVQVAGVVAAVIVQADGHVVAIFELWNQVAAAYLHRVQGPTRRPAGPSASPAGKSLPACPRRGKLPPVWCW